MRTGPAVERMLSGDDGRDLVLFIHGMWLHASSWRGWVREFDRAGYQNLSFRWPGEPASVAVWRGTRRALPVSIGRLQSDIAGLIDARASKPIAIGHGAGGLLAEILLQTGAARAAISITPPPVGLPAAASAARLGRAPRTVSWFTLSRGSVTPTPAQFRQAIANAIPGHDAARLYEQHVTPGQPWPLLRSLLRARRDSGGRGLTSANRGPLLLIGAAQDRLIHESTIGALHQTYRRRHPGAVTDYQIFLDQAHSLTIDAGWRSVAFYCLDWLTRQDL
jgi:non-heme chloroperoxidase